MEPIIASRIAAIRSILTKENLDAILILVQENRFYLSGYTGEDTQFDESAGALVISADQLVLATDSRFDLQAQSEANGYEIVIYKQGLEQVLPEIVESLGARRLGFESVRISHKQHAALSKALAGQTPSAELIPTENTVENLRKIKSEDEIERTIRALRLAENAFSKVLADLRPGLTEKEVAWSMEKAMREAGAEGLSFPVIVASGPNSASPHAIPSDRQLKTGEPILFDWGVRLDQYCSDTTRTVILGHLDDRFKKVFDTVVEARDKATAAIRAGVGGMAIDSIARDHIDKTDLPANSATAWDMAPDWPSMRRRA